MFLHNESLQTHIRYLFRKGSIFLTSNDVLLLHAGIPLNQDGSFMSQTIDNKPFKGKALLQQFEKKIRNAYLNRYEQHNPELDYFMLLWQAPTSPLFAKDRMRTFERYFIKDTSTHKEIMNPYFTLRENPEVLDRIFEEFGIEKTRGKIINGHVPLDITKGHKVMLANKRIYLIDGGMSKQYATKTNIGGYTLISDSYAFYLVSHSRFSTYSKLIESEKDIVSVTHSEDINDRRTYIYDTDKGKSIKATVDDLARLIDLYRQGILKEKDYKQD